MTVSLGCLWRTLDRLGLRLKKSRFVPPTRKASASSAPSPTVIGRRRLSSPACAAMGSLLPSSSWTDQRRMVPHLCREGARTDAAARRHRDPGQSQLAQRRRRARDHRGTRRHAPDLNPIEQLFAKLKALLRKAAARLRSARNATALKAPLRVRCECGARGDTCGWRLSSCADCVNLSGFVSCCGALRGAQCRRAPQSCGNRIPTNSCLCYANAVPSRRDAE